jgi:hypothetical protein
MYIHQKLKPKRLNMCQNNINRTKVTKNECINNFYIKTSPNRNKVGKYFILEQEKYTPELYINLKTRK